MPLEDSEGFTQLAMGTAGAERAFAATEPQKHGLSVQFYMHPLQDAAQTLAKGRPIFKETEYVRIMVPGDKASVVERPVRLGFFETADDQRFAAEYARFKQNKNQEVTGTPLSEWPPLTRSQVKEMEYFNVRTVEQLAEMSDTHMQKFMGLQSIRDLARRFMQHAEGVAPLTKMQAALDQSANEQATMFEQIQAMSSELAILRGQASQGPAGSAIEIIGQGSFGALTGTSVAEPTRAAAPVEEGEDFGTKYSAEPMSLEGAEVVPDDEQVAEQVAAAVEPVKKTRKRRSIAE